MPNKETMSSIYEAIAALLDIEEKQGEQQNEV